VRKNLCVFSDVCSAVEDVVLQKSKGIHGVLIGETLMKVKDPHYFIQDVKSACRQPPIVKVSFLLSLD
jgi:indole-3-glycerol phosphate synthase